MRANFKNIAGKRFGRLVAKKVVRGKKKGGAYWRCECDCGEIAICRGDRLRSGNTSSCGCKNIEWADWLLDVMAQQDDCREKERTISLTKARKKFFSKQRKASS